MDHLRSGSTSPVGTFQRPVSPRNVVVAGRVSVEPVAAAGFLGAAGVCEGVWAAAGRATVSARTPAARACLIGVHLIHCYGRAWTEGVSKDRKVAGTFSGKVPATCQQTVRRLRVFVSSGRR